MDDPRVDQHASRFLLYSVIDMANASRAKTALKTQKNDASVGDFLDAIDDVSTRDDARALVALMKKVTGETPKMWGKSIVGFGQYHYRYPTGREADWLAIGFSPRAKNLTLYLMAGFGKMGPLLGGLGKHSTAKSCLYIRRLADVDQKVLAAILRQGFEEVKALERTMASAAQKKEKKAKKAAPKKKAKKAAPKKKALRARAS